MLKYCIITIVIVSAVAYCVTILLDTGLAKVEDVTHLKRNAERRLEIIQSVIKDHRFQEIVDIQEIEGGMDFEHPKANDFKIETGDSVSVVVMALGNPMSQEVVNGYLIYKYRKCNIVIAQDKVIGWSLK